MTIAIAYVCHVSGCEANSHFKCIVHTITYDNCEIHRMPKLSCCAIHVMYGFFVCMCVVMQNSPEVQLLPLLQLVLAKSVMSWGGCNLVRVRASRIPWGMGLYPCFRSYSVI